MKLEDIMKLVDAGYTKAEIAAFEQSESSDQKKDPENKPQGKPEEPKKPEAPKPDENKPADPVIQKLDALISAIQLSNIAGTGRDGNSSMTAEDVVKNLFDIKKGVM